MGKRLSNADGAGGAKKRAASKQAKTVEFAERLDHIAKTYPAARLMVDLAHDAGLEIYSKQGKQIRKLSNDVVKAKKKRSAMHHRLIDLLHKAATSPVGLPRPPEHPVVEHDQLLVKFRQFRSTAFPALAQLLHAKIGRADATVFQKFLVDEILIKGSWIMVEHLMRHAGEPRTAEDDAVFAEQLRDHIAGRVGQRLARQAGYQMTADVGQQRDVLIGKVVAFLDALLTATPPGRLLLPLPNSIFDPVRHAPIAACPDTGELRMTAMLFPGYVVFGDTERVEEKAQVYTEFVEDEE